MPWDSGYKFLSFCHVFGSVAPWCGSFVYHLFMNIEKGENVYYTLLKLDMVGIWVSQSFGEYERDDNAWEAELFYSVHIQTRNQLDRGNHQYIRHLFGGFILDELLHWNASAKAGLLIIMANTLASYGGWKLFRTKFARLSG